MSKIIAKLVALIKRLLGWVDSERTAPTAQVEVAVTNIEQTTSEIKQSLLPEPQQQKSRARAAHNQTRTPAKPRKPRTNAKKSSQ